MVPLRFGDAEQFAALRDFLKEADYTEKGVCERLGLRALHEFLLTRQGPRGAPEAIDPLRVLIRLFLIGEHVSGAEIQLLISATAREAMNTLGLLCHDSSKLERCHATVALYPTQGLYIASDRWTRPDGSPIQEFDDIVYPAITANTQKFLEMLPPEPCDDFLDLCSGTGVAALAAAGQYARHAWAIDIAERSAQFAEFNRLLNGLTNVAVLKGDLYEPAGGSTFDRIVAHPPYVPVLKPAEIYYDGGDDGERVTRGIVEGLPRWLRPGGRLYCLTMGVEREGEPFEQRVRRWLQEQESDFDVLLVVKRIVDPSEFAFQSAVKARGGTEHVEELKMRFEKLKVKNLVQGALVIQRKDSARPPFTARRQGGAHSGRAETEWLMRWETASAHPKIVQFLLDSRPIASPKLELRVLHRMRRGELTPSEFTLQTDYPFSMECKSQPWMAMLAARCDGKMTALEHFEMCKRDRLIHPDTPAEEFANLLRVLVSGGLLEIEGFRPPEDRGTIDQFKVHGT